MKFIDSLKKKEGKKERGKEDMKIEEGLFGQRIETNRGRGKEMVSGVIIYTVRIYANVRMELIVMYNSCI